jgi:signal transduction histidine kinase/DNA-binding response OmpR family regulator
MQVRPPSVSVSVSGTYARSDLEELRGDALRLLATSLVVAGAAAVIATGLLADVVALETWMVGVSLAAVAVVARRALGLGLPAATAVLVVGLGAALTGTILLYPGAPIVCLLCLVVFLASAFHGWTAGSATAVGTTALVATLAWGPARAISSGDAVVATLLAWLSVCASSLVSRPLQTTLDWSWQSFSDALATTQQARVRQGELGRLSKSLAEAYDRMEHLARDLDRARQAADEARRLKSEFAAAISHELRTPLNLIIGFSEMMVVSPRSAYGQPLPEGYAGDLDVIYRNACHMSSLIDDILDLSQIDADRMALQKRPAALDQVVQQALSGLAPRVEQQGLMLTVDVPADLPPVFVDPIRVRQVLINLVINAVRFTDAGGIAVGARLAEDQQEILVSVSDTGVGIAPEDIPHVFDEFKQTGEPIRRRGGAGLGLTVSKRFVELHGGNMWAESVLGRGSTFFFTLPRHGNVVASAYSPQTALPERLGEGGPAREVVVVDEAGDVARVLARYLDGFTVVRAGDVAQARRMVEQGAAQAVLLGTPAAAAAWAQGRAAGQLARRVPVLSCPLHTMRSFGEELGVVEYLLKPVSRDRLRVALLAAARRRGADRSAGGGRDGASRSRRRVLVAEDDPEMGRLLVQTVRSCAKTADVWLAPDGAACLELVESVQPDVLLLDLLMPRVDGYGVLAKLRADERFRDLPVIIISAKGNREETVSAGTIAISRADGLSVAEAVRCLRTNLDLLVEAPTGIPAGPRAESVA